MQQKKLNSSLLSPTPKTITIGLLVIILCVSLVLAYLQGKIYETRDALRLKQVNVVSSLKGYAPITDDKLTDAWGLEFGHAGRIWVNNSSGYSTVYNGKGELVHTTDGNVLAVQVPLASGATDDSAPLTGMVFSEANAFSGDSFVFVTEEGTIAGWNKNPDGTEPLQATMRVNNFDHGAVYKGATSAKTDKGWVLYVANFGQGRVDVFDTQYKPVASMRFTDPDLPKDYAPFNIKNIGGKIYVTYAKQSIDKSNDIPGLGNGYIDVFTTDGVLVKRLISNGMLNSPWGIVMTPSNFGKLRNYLLVGNFGDGYINVFDPNTGDYIGTIHDQDGNPLQIDKLWSLTFGTNNGAGKSNELFFTAGESAEDQGVFGKLQLVSSQE